MGMYDYIGHSGDQVKCFYVPCISINPTTDPPTVCFGTSGGRLECVNDAPYMTPYYNYGKDFVILSGAFIWDGHATEIHVVRDGKWVETIKIEEMPDTYDMPSTVVGYQGTRYKAHTVAELKQMLADYIWADETYNSIFANGLEQHNLSGRLLNIDRARTLPHDELMAEINIRNELHTVAYENSTKPINEKWLDTSHESDAELIGLAYATWEMSKDPNRYQYPEEEWKAIVADLYDRLKDMGDLLEVYKDWCAKEGIVVDHEEVKHFVDMFRP